MELTKKTGADFSNWNIKKNYHLFFERARIFSRNSCIEITSKKRVYNFQK